MMGWFYTCQHSVIMGGKMTTPRCPSSAFLKGEKGKVLTRKIAEKAEKKELNIFLNNYTIPAISIGFALRRIVHAKAPRSPRRDFVARH